MRFAIAATVHLRYRRLVTQAAEQGGQPRVRLPHKLVDDIRNIVAVTHLTRAVVSSTIDEAVDKAVDRAVNRAVDQAVDRALT